MRGECPSRHRNGLPPKKARRLVFEVPATWTLRSSPSTKEAGPIGIGGAGGCGSLKVERALSCETGDRGRPRRETPHQRVGGFGSWRHQPTNSLFTGSQPPLTPSLRATSKMCEAHKGDSMVQRGSERCTTVTAPRSSSERPGNPCEMPRFGTLGGRPYRHICVPDPAVHSVMLLCQGACGLGGQDWDGPHRVGGQALIRSHRPGSGWWVGSTGHYEDSTGGASAGLLGQTPPGSLCSSWEVFERLAGDVAFQTAHDLGR
jgi:hypothetical protein